MFKFCEMNENETNYLINELMLTQRQVTQPIQNLIYETKII